jgi:hypothetical protein
MSRFRIANNYYLFIDKSMLRVYIGFLRFCFASGVPRKMPVMRHDDWMSHDERTPEEKRRDRFSSLKAQEADLVRDIKEREDRLAKLREELYDPTVMEPFGILEN